MAYLDWISNKEIKDCVRYVLLKAFEGISKSKEDFYRNGVDPFSATFDAACNNISIEDWMQSEQIRQSQKTLQNALGHFHQHVLAKVDGWEIPDENFIDLVNEEERIVVELKNKHNTVKKSDLKNTYDELQQAVMHKTSTYRGYTGFYVTIIPKNHERFNREFRPSDNANKTQKPANPLIREMDGYSFYNLITGSESALSDLYKALPKIIKAVLAEDQFQEYPQDQLKHLMTDSNRLKLFAKAFG